MSGWRTSTAMPLLGALALTFLSQQADAYFSGIRPGLAFCVVLVTMELLTVLTCWRHRNLPRPVLGFLTLLTFADLTTTVRTHYLNLPITSTGTLLLGTVPYILTYFAGSYAIVTAMRPRVFKKLGVLPVPFAVAGLISSFFLIPALSDLVLTRGFDPYTIARCLNAVASLGFLILGIAVLTHSTDRLWNSFGLCAATLILANFCLSTEVFRGGRYQIGLFHYGWFFGVSQFCLNFVLPTSRRLSSVWCLYAKSISGNVRGVLFVAGAAAGFLVLNGLVAPIPFVRIAFLSCVAGLVLCLILGEMVVRVFADYARATGSALEDFYLSNDPLALENLPVEIRAQIEDRLARAAAETKARLEAARAQEAAAAKLAHDIRSPLSALSLVVSSLDPKDEALVALGDAALTRATEMADSFLRETRRMGTTETRSLDLKRLLSLLLVEKRAEHRGVGVSLDLHVTDETFPMVAKESDLGRAFSNLLNNAVEACERGGRVQVTLRREKGSCRLTIEDEGKGIPPHVLARLGEPHFSHGKENGNGLGVYQAFQALRQAGGRWSVDSRPGSGTRFDIDLPLADA